MAYPILFASIGRLAAAFVLFLLPFGARAQTKLVAFDGSTPEIRWFPLTDQVRGGRSTIDLKVTESGTATIEGKLTLIDGAGFSSVRATRLAEPFVWDLSSASEIVFNARGDGRLYRILLKDRVAAQSGDSYNYEASFVSSPDFAEVRIPLRSFAPLRRGRPFPAPALDVREVVEIGLQLNDKIEGPFRLEIGAISASTGK